jgi:hypothetical protein
VAQRYYDDRSWAPSRLRAKGRQFGQTLGMSDGRAEVAAHRIAIAGVPAAGISGASDRIRLSS